MFILLEEQKTLKDKNAIHVAHFGLEKHNFTKLLPIATGLDEPFNSKI